MEELRHEGPAPPLRGGEVHLWRLGGESAGEQLPGILAGYLDCPTEEVVIRREPDGKPRVEGVHFNLSHSGGLQIVAVANAEVGVDLERISPRRRCRALAERFYSEREQELLSSLGEEELGHSFHRIWVRKEALLKGIGVGIRGSLAKWDMSAGSPDGFCFGDDWWIYDVPMEEPFVAALAVRERMERVVWLEIPQ